MTCSIKTEIKKERSRRDWSLLKSRFVRRFNYSPLRQINDDKPFIVVLFVGMITSKLQRELPYATHRLEALHFKERSFTSFPLSKGQKGRALSLLPGDETHRNNDGRNSQIYGSKLCWGKATDAFKGVKIVLCDDLEAIVC